jgi:hypothetical protein
MEKNTLITIFVFFLLSNQLYKIFWEILKALLYLYAIVIGLNYINPAVAGTLKKYLSFILQFDKNIFQIVLSNISNEIMKFVGNKNINLLKDNIRNATNIDLPQVQFEKNIPQKQEEQYQYQEQYQEQEQEEQYQEQEEQ